MSGSGPRDWSPAGYWDEPSAPRATGRAGRAGRRPAARTATATATATVRPSRGWLVPGFVSLFAGIVAVVAPLGVVLDGRVGGWVVTTVGITAVGFAIESARRRRAWRGSAGVLAWVGGVLGVVGTLLCLWTVAAASLPDAVPPAPRLVAGDLGGIRMLTAPVGAAGRTIEVQVQAIEGACASGTSCWAWQVVPAEACTTATATVGFASTPDGGPEFEETRVLSDLRPGVATSLVIADDGRYPGLARIERVTCAD
ncbi:hypothetical protein ACDF64_16960 [Agromyces sp. MMS24-JH15]|uniref:hypothetical protein n=1 Tax=Agromyces sp. MMS24-JH15 TaxID=3243765 RepID=UPI00374A3232